MVIETRVTRPAVANHCRNPGQIYIYLDTQHAGLQVYIPRQGDIDKYAPEGVARGLHMH